MYVGIDDTDSINGMCTTYLCKLVIDELSKSSDIHGFPRLIRLNPNIPYKTRGNGALSFRVKGDSTHIYKTVKKIVKKNIMADPNTNPGIVFLEGNVPLILNDFYKRSLHEMINIEEAHSLAREIGAKTLIYGNGRGVIGALASIGAKMPEYTYELIAYRDPKNIGMPRQVDEDSVKAVDKVYFPTIFDSYDWHNKYIAISPRSPCPILYGLRGNDIDVLKKASLMIDSEEVSKKQMFITNQATDVHIEEKPICNIVEYNSVKISGKVSENPHYEHKGHVFFKINDNTGDIICAAYEPTKEFRTHIMELKEGDLVEIWGGVKRTKFGLTVNIEKIKVIELEKFYRNVVPLCCGKKMQSIGAGKGYRCKLCSKKISYPQIEKVKLERKLCKGYYEVPVIARRHLSKPLSILKA